MTHAIEDGARAVICLPVYANGHKASWSSESAWEAAKACIEAAIASGALVPASAVAEMRERCAKVASDLSDAWATEWRDGHKSDSHLEGMTDGSDYVAVKIRQLDLSPACGEYVVVPRESTQEMIDAATTSTSGCGLPDNDYDEDVKTHWTAMLNAASSNGGGE